MCTKCIQTDGHTDIFKTDYMYQLILSKSTLFNSMLTILNNQKAHLKFFLSRDSPKVLSSTWDSFLNGCCSLVLTLFFHLVGLKEL